MDREQYKRIAGELDMRPSLAGALLTLAMWLSTLGLGFWLLQSSSLPLRLLAQFPLAIAFFQAFCIVHECGHDSLVRSRSANILIGHLASAFCAQPFYAWKYIHREHHTWAGHTDRDPVVAKRNQWRKTGEIPLLARFAWRSWIPMVAALQHLVYWGYPLKLAKSPEPEDRKKARHCAASLLVMFGLQSLTLWLLIRFDASINIVGAVLLYLILAELVNLPHHTDLPSYDRKLGLREQWMVTRSCYYPYVVSELCVLNFNFHIEHHLYPSLPWYRLRKAREAIRHALRSDYREARGIAWNLEHRSRRLQDVVAAGSGRS